MFEAAEAVMRPEMVMGERRLGSDGLEAVMVMLVGQPAPWLRRQVAPSTDERLNAVAQSSPSSRIKSCESTVSVRFEGMGP